MQYYKIIIKQIPQIAFAHCYKTNRYFLNFAPSPGLIEITYIDQGDVIKTCPDGSQLLIPEKSVSVELHNCAFEMKSKAEQHCHYTVGFTAKYDIQLVTKEQILNLSREITNQSESDYLIAIVPDYFEINQYNSHIESRIKRIINSHSYPDAAENINCIGMLLELLAELTKKCIHNIMLEGDEMLSPASAIYVQRAMQYISEHLECKITVDEIASYLEISSGYLSYLFKNVADQTIIEYINTVKLNRVKEILTACRATLKEAGEAVGIFDENYLSRMFKKYTGMTVRDYKMLKK